MGKQLTKLEKREREADQDHERWHELCDLVEEETWPAKTQGTLLHLLRNKS